MMKFKEYATPELNDDGSFFLFKKRSEAVHADLWFNRAIRLGARRFFLRGRVKRGRGRAGLGGLLRRHGDCGRVLRDIH